MPTSEAGKTHTTYFDTHIPDHIRLLHRLVEDGLGDEYRGSERQLVKINLTEWDYKEYPGLRPFREIWFCYGKEGSK